MIDKIATNCKSIDWMINRSSEYLKDEDCVTYRFRGNVPMRMRREADEWMRERGATYTDGRERSGYTLRIEETIDTERRWYRSVNLRVTHGVYHSTATNVEMSLTIYDCPISDEDWADMQQVAA